MLIFIALDKFSPLTFLDFDNRRLLMFFNIESSMTITFFSRFVIVWFFQWDVIRFND